MLYDLLRRSKPFFGVLNVVRYITFRTAAPALTALAISLVLGPGCREAARLPDRPGDPAGRAAVAPREGRDADHGRLLIRQPQSRRRCCGGPVESLYLDRRARHVAVRRRGVCRRLLKIVRRSHHGLRPRYKMGFQIIIAIGVGIA